MVLYSPLFFMVVFLTLANWVIRECPFPLVPGRHCGSLGAFIFLLANSAISRTFAVMATTLAVGYKRMTESEVVELWEMERYKVHQ